MGKKCMRRAILENVLGRSAVVGVIDFPPFYWLVGSGVGRAHINPNGPEKLQLDAFNRRS